ncbi:AMP-dependent synthetase/ligase [Oceanibacterium hippocampi]|uniref:Long-chain-fatty-acid--CoA ligase FadD15 n=1 Tax=Oceanibacterium hippocampi TaxID=745714 RepID=A0A1Y5TU42_9PROT|nr:AMP-binding protein [Oceanibacterium hippocampi]SLN72752.1 Long-chain-fatty-acid--CoA ligase FadD15 [Oceanibacterium hippocampi]
MSRLEGAGTGAVTYPPTVIDGCDTVPKLFHQRVVRLGDKIAMREKKFGIWRSITWREYGEHVKHVSLGLVSLGFAPGDVTSVMSENNPEWLYCDLGTLCAGGVTNGVYTTDSAKQVAYLCRDSGTRYFFAENEEFLDKILEARDQIPSLEKIIVFDMEGLRDLDDPMVISFDDLLERGRAYAADHPEVWEQRRDVARPDDLAILIYTSGTTGPPKGAMISHRNLLFQMAALTEIIEFGETDQQLSFLPLCHIAERNFTIFGPIYACSTVNFAEDLDTVPENVREVQPTVFFAVPRIWEKFYSSITLRMHDATAFGRWAYRVAIGIGQEMAAHRIDGTRPPALLRARFWLADQLVLRNVKRMLGLDRTHYLGTGAAPISPDLIRWYLSLGLDMYEVYGQTENTGLATTNFAGNMKLGTVGKAAPGTEVRLSPEGEILLRGPHVFLGYLNQPEKTAETVVDGWLHTGDVGAIDNEGYVKITDRMKDIIITAGGKNITPSEIENQLKFSPYVSDAVVIGDKRKFLSCLVMIDQENVEKYAQDNDIPFTNFASLCNAPAVIELIGQEIERVNGNFAQVEKIKKFRLIEQQLTAEDDELTPTMKLKRKFVNEKYRELIESMYREAA